MTGQETCARCAHPESKHTADGRRLCWADLQAFRRCSCAGWIPAAPSAQPDEAQCTCPTEWWDVLRSFDGPGGVHLVPCPVYQARRPAQSVYGVCDVD